MRRQFPSLRGTTCRNNGRSAWNGSRFEYICAFYAANTNIHGVKLKISGYALGIWLPVSHAPSCIGTTNPSRTGLNPLNIMGLDHGLSPGRLQAIIWINDMNNIVNWTLRNNLRWNFNCKSQFSPKESAYEYVVCKMAEIKSHDGINEAKRSTATATHGLLLTDILVFDEWSKCCISIAWSKTALYPVRKQWEHSGLALSHLY